MQEMEKPGTTMEHSLDGKHQQINQSCFNWDSTLCHNNWSSDIFSECEMEDTYKIHIYI